MWADTCKHMPELAEEKSNVYATVTGSFVLTAIIKKRKNKRKEKTIKTPGQPCI